MSATPPRVVHIASGREWRGGQHQVLLLARGLQQRGVATTVVTGTDTALARRLEEAHVPVATARWTVAIDPRIALRLIGLLSSRTIVHAHDSHAHLLADFAIRVQRVPLVVTRRVALPIRNPRRYRRADALIAISAAVRRELLAAGVDPGRIHLVPDAIDPGDSEEREPPDRFPQGPAVSPLIVCVAALTREKGIDTLLDAAAFEDLLLTFKLLVQGSLRNTGVSGDFINRGLVKTKPFKPFLGKCKNLTSLFGYHN